MTSRRHLLLALLTAGAAAGPAAGSAGAETICVHAPAGTACDGGTAPDLTTALQAAQASLEPSTILLGASQAGPFTYPDGPILAGNGVTVRGVGPTRPVLTGPPGATIVASGELSLDGIDVHAGLAGIGIDAAFGTLHDVRVAGGETAVRAHDQLTLDGVSIAGAATGVLVQDGETVDVAHSRISATQAAVVTRGTITVRASVLEGDGAGAFGLRGGDGDAQLDHVTAVHRGAVSGNEVGLQFHPVDAGGRADVSSVVVAGFPHAIEHDPSEGAFTLPMTIRDSVWDDTHDLFVDVPGTGGVVQGGNAHADPRLVDLDGGDLRLRGSSPAVDRDSQTAPGYEDVDGAGVVGGAADAGALEYQRRAPVIETADVPAGGDAGQALAFAAAASDADGDAVALAWDFGDGTTAAGAAASHAFAAGSRTVTLTATDEAGLATTRSFSVTVTGSGASAPPPPRDVRAPKLSQLRLSKDHRRVLFTISERARVRVTARGRTVTRTVAAGRRSIRIARVRRGSVRLQAVDAAGNRSATLRVKVAS